MTANQSEYPVIFVGPSIPFADIENEISAICLPPAAQGSMIVAVERYAPPAILLIDGNFQTEPAIRHKEILWTLSQGIHVFGASSMGALRAAELWRYGMVGVGLAFRWYRRFPLLRDDAVAVLHAPAELGYNPFTNSLIDLRMTTRAAFRGGLISKDAREDLDQAASRVGFRDRTLSKIVDLATGKHIAPSNAEKTKSVLEKCYIDQKRADSLTALRLLHRMHTAGELRRQPKKPFTMTTAFQRDLQNAGMELPQSNDTF